MSRPNPYYDFNEHWRAQVDQANRQLGATAYAIGAAGYLLSPRCDLSNAERLVQLAEVIAELRTELDLPPKTTTSDPETSDAAGQTGPGGGEGL